MKGIFSNFKVVIFYMVNVVALELQFARKILSMETRCDLSTAKVMNFLEGSVQTLILPICICFSNCSFGLLMSMSYSEYFPSKSGQSVLEDRLLKKSVR